LRYRISSRSRKALNKTQTRKKNTNSCCVFFINTTQSILKILLQSKDFYTILIFPSSQDTFFMQHLHTTSFFCKDQVSIAWTMFTLCSLNSNNCDRSLCKYRNIRLVVVLYFYTYLSAELVPSTETEFHTFHDDFRLRSGMLTNREHALSFIVA